MGEDRGEWEPWRQDDDGNRLPVARFHSRTAADAEQHRFEALLHKQTYRVQPRPAEPGA